MQKMSRDGSPRRVSLHDKAWSVEASSPQQPASPSGSEESPSSLPPFIAVSPIDPSSPIGYYRHPPKLGPNLPDLTSRDPTTLWHISQDWKLARAYHTDWYPTDPGRMAPHSVNGRRIPK